MITTAVNHDAPADILGEVLKRNRPARRLAFRADSTQEIAVSVIGTVKHGVIELPPDARLEEGQRVEIVAASLPPDDALVLRETVMAAPRVRDLPNDLATNLDYYLHGHDHKQQPRRGRWIPAAKAMPEMTAQQAEEFAGKLLRAGRRNKQSSARFGLPPRPLTARPPQVMTRVFADTWFYLAALNPADPQQPVLL